MDQAQRDELRETVAGDELRLDALPLFLRQADGRVHGQPDAQAVAGEPERSLDEEDRDQGHFVPDAAAEPPAEIPAPVERIEQRRLQQDRGIAGKGELQRDRGAQRVAADDARVEPAVARRGLMVEVGERHVLGPQPFDPQNDRQVSDDRHVLQRRGIIRGHAEVVEPREPGLEDQVHVAVRVGVPAGSADDERRRVLVPRIIVDQPPGERLHGDVQAHGVLMVAEIAGGRPPRLAVFVADRRLPAVQPRLDRVVARADQRRIPRRAGDGVPILFEIRNPQQVKRIVTEEIGHVRHPGRQTPPLVIARFELHRLAAIHPVDDVDELAVHLAPGDLLFAEHDVEVVRPVADVQLAHDALEVVVRPRGLLLAGREQARGRLPVVHPVVQKIVDVRDLDGGRDLIVHFQFQQILHLREPEILLAVAHAAVARKLNVRPLAEEAAKGQGRNLPLDGLAHVAAGRVERREKPVETRPGVPYRSDLFFEDGSPARSRGEEQHHRAQEAAQHAAHDRSKPVFVCHSSLSWFVLPGRSVIPPASVG